MAKVTQRKLKLARNRAARAKLDAEIRKKEEQLAKLGTGDARYWALKADIVALRLQKRNHPVRVRRRASS